MPTSIPSCLSKRLQVHPILTATSRRNLMSRVSALHLKKKGDIRCYGDPKIKKFSRSHKYRRDDIINKSTTTDFQYKILYNRISISTLSHVAPEQSVAIKGYLAHLSANKTIMLQRTPLETKRNTSR